MKAIVDIVENRPPSVVRLGFFCIGLVFLGIGGVVLINALVMIFRTGLAEPLERDVGWAALFGVCLAGFGAIGLYVYLIPNRVLRFDRAKREAKLTWKYPFWISTPPAILVRR